jgi:type II secretory pathway pseudopilin PulG
MTKTKTKTRMRSKLARQKGYMLLAVMLLITLMLVALSIELPRIAQQIKREKEEELVHRGSDYCIAIKKFYHKNATYPLSLEQLEDTNHIRFLRKRYKDPMTADGEWKLVHLGEAEIKLTPPAGGNSSTTNNPNGSIFGNNTNGNNANSNNTAVSNGSGSFGSNNQSGSGGDQPGSGGNQSGAGGNQPGLGGNQSGAGGNQPGLGGNQSGAGGNQPGSGGNQPGQMGTLTVQNIGTGLGPNSQVGGPMIGVASKSKKTSIKEFNGNSEYDQWLFVYDPRLEQLPGYNGCTIASPTLAAQSNTKPAPK